MLSPLQHILNYSIIVPDNLFIFEFIARLIYLFIYYPYGMSAIYILQDNYYKPQGSYVCLPCKCYGHGSKGYQCDPVTGQCPCIEGVTGRRCNQCPSKYAEIRQDEETKKYGCRGT
jgi:hypothetical protein